MSRRPSTVSITSQSVGNGDVSQSLVLPHDATLSKVYEKNVPRSPQASFSVKSGLQLPSDPLSLDPDELFTKYTIAEMKLVQQRLRWVYPNKRSYFWETQTPQNRSRCEARGTQTDGWVRNINAVHNIFISSCEAQRTVSRSSSSFQLYNIDRAVRETCNTSFGGGERSYRYTRQNGTP